MNTIFRNLCLFTCLLLAFAATSHAQEAPVPPSNPIVPLEPQVENPDEMVGLIVLSDESALQVLDMLEKMTGKIILRRQDIAAVKINFNSRGPLTKGEAVLALESLLSLNAIMLTDMGGRFMKAVPATNVNSHVPKMLMGTTLDLPPSQQIYAKLFTFDYLQAETTNGTTITPLLSQNSNAVVYPKSNAVLITDALLNLQRIERIINEMDKPQEVREEIKFIKLGYIQAQEMQQRIENLIQGPLKSYLEGNTSVTADERTNQLILITHPGNLDIIMDVIENVDVDAAPLTSSEVFPLRQAKAEEVVPIIEEIISGQKEGREEDAKTDITKNNNANKNNANKNNNNKGPLPQPAAQVASQNTATGSSTNSSLQFSNFVGLSADERTNAIVAYGTHSDLRTLKELIDKIDIPLPQVRIEVIITEVALSENLGSGLSKFNLTYNDALPTDPILENTTGPLTLGLDSVSATGAQFGNFALDAVLDIAESDSDIKILSTPTIIVSHNEEGIINVSESRPFETSSYTGGNVDSVTRNQVEYRDVGIKLTVTPLIGADGSITMTIEQTVDTVKTVDDPASEEVNTTPIIGKREANSTITVNDRQLIILGGLQENQKDTSHTYFPLIGRLPGFKQILSGESVLYTRTELIIFVRPTILKTPDEAVTMSEEQLDVLKEGQAVRDYLESGTTGNIYMDGSGLIEEEEEEEEEAPKESKQRSTRRVGTTGR
jgi:general secretion pathway protein D